MATLLAMANGFAVAQAASDRVTAGTKAEGWYVTPARDACADADCGAVPSSQYPRDTLHVGISHGTSTTATYVELDLLAVPYGAALRHGTLRLPVDMVPGDGSLRADTATLRVCQVTGPVPDTKASPGKPPDTDCATSVPASYSAKPTPTFTADLAPFLSGWSDGVPAAVAILPAPKAVKAAETWHVAFFGKDYRASQTEPTPPEQPPAPPAPTTEAASLSEPSSTPTPPPSDAPTDQQQKPRPITANLTFHQESFAAPVALSPLRVQPELGPPPPVAAAGPLAAPSPQVGKPVSAAPAVPARQLKHPANAPAPAAAPRFIRVGYAYPIAWLFPLLLLIGFAFAGHSLTRDIQHPDRSFA